MIQSINSSRLQWSIYPLDMVNTRGTAFLPLSSTDFLLTDDFVSPGRFFAASELKIMLAHVVVTYDVRLEDDAMYPASWHIGTFIAANPRANVVFRNRVA